MDHLKRLMQRFPVLIDMEGELMRAYDLLEDAYSQGGKLLLCGNGGSAADCDHIVGELMKGFYKKRPLDSAEREGLGDLGDRLQGALPAISLTGHSALSTAFLNDVAPELVFAQQVYGYGICTSITRCVRCWRNIFFLTQTQNKRNLFGFPQEQ